MGIVYSIPWFEERTSDLFTDAQSLVNACERGQEYEAILCARDLAATARALLRFLERRDHRKEVLGW